MRQGMDASPIQSPWQGVSRLAQALLGGYEARKGDEEITDTAEKRRKMAAELMAPYQPGRTTPNGSSRLAHRMGWLHQFSPSPRSLWRLPTWHRSSMTQQRSVASRRNSPRRYSAPKATSIPRPATPVRGVRYRAGAGQHGRQSRLWVQPISSADLADPGKAVPWALDHLKGARWCARRDRLEQPAAGCPAVRAYGENTDDYERKVLGGAGFSCRLRAPTDNPAPPVPQDLSEAQFYEGKAMQAQAAGLHQEAALLMQRAQRAQAAGRWDVCRPSPPTIGGEMRRGMGV